MLAHLQDLDLSSLLEDLDVRHVFLLDLLDSHFVLSFDLSSHFYKTELPLPESLLEFIKIEYVGIFHNLL